MRQRMVAVGYVMCAVFGTGCQDFGAWWDWGRGHHGHAGSPAAGTGGAGGAPAPSSEPRLPSATAACPTLQTGTAKFKGIDVQLWVGANRDDHKAPVMIYWHATGSVAAEAQAMLGPAQQAILDEGGLIAAPASSTGTGRNTDGPSVWTTDDFSIADEVVACAIEQLNIDTHRIYTAGCSAGGQHASVMAYERSAYLAAAIPNSGGTLTDWELQDSGHVPAIMAAHGAPESDVVIISFAEATQRFTQDIADLGGFSVVCGHSGGHCGSPAALKNAQWQFLKAHPFGVNPQPYAAGLPASFPRYCEIVE